MSEELLQKSLNNGGLVLGPFEYYNLGSTTLNDLKKYKIIPAKNYDSYGLRKPDGLLVDRRNKKKLSVILAIEWKRGEKFINEKDKIDAVEQCNDIAQEIGAKIGLATDGQDFIWFNPNNKNKDNEYKDRTTGKIRSYNLIVNENNTLLKNDFIVDQKNDEENFDNLKVKTQETIKLIQKILTFIDSQHSKMEKGQAINPTTLAGQIWQDVWSVAGATPEKCLYTFVELFIFKYLSDLGILQEDDKGNKVNFDYIFSLDPDKAFRNYTDNVRPYLKVMFPASEDDQTTIINGTVLNPNVDEHRLVFYKILSKFKKFGPLKNIDPGFKSQVFEAFMKRSISQKKWGQFFTPRNIVDAIISISDIDKLPVGSKICDPACGVGGFILEPIKVKEEREDGLNFYYKIEGKEIKPRYEFFGFDKGFEREEQLTIILAKANMLIFVSDLLKQNPSLSKEFSTLFNSTFKLFHKSILGSLSKINKNYYDLILTNPPYVIPGSSNYKEAIKNNPELSEFYKINATGLEGLFIEWIVRSIKPNAKAFIIIPDGILNRLSDAKLRNFIQEECFIDGIISLPQDAFYTTSKKTYILALTRKNFKTDIQKNPILAYIVSSIGETLDINRFSTPENNDLPDMVNQFNQFKGSKNSFVPQNKRCKTLPFEKFNNAEHWVIDRFWSNEELIALGVKEEIKNFSVDDYVSLIQQTEISIGKLKNDLLDLSYELEKSNKDEQTIQRNIGGNDGLFKIEKGKSEYTKSYINNNKGEYPVYSSKTTEDGIIGNIDHYDYETECLTWTTDGTYVGTVYYRNGKFSMTTHCGALIPKVDNIHLPYFLYILNRDLSKYYAGEGSNRRITVNIIQDVSVPIPIKKDGSFDINKQIEIAEKYKKLEDIKTKLKEEMQILSEVKISFD
ncbi:MAG: N-6 DNA methylase [Candidatus Paceibacterota bacterium]|jgi:type I restriction-modification system DNA methylase subunit